jgi:NTP pyrophosphatase (non-canonical NTP hydrolase)
MLPGVALNDGLYISRDKIMNINEIAEKQFEWVERMGWHNKTVLESLALIASEVGEAVNECRNGAPSDNFGTELADIVLRVADLAHCECINLAEKIAEKMAINEARGTRGRKV